MLMFLNYPPRNQPSLDPYLSHSKCLNSPVKRITKHVVTVVIRDLHPGVLVEGAGFKVLIDYMEPGYHVPTSTHITEVVKQKFVKRKDNIKCYFQSEVHFMVMTTDIWTSHDS